MARHLTDPRARRLAAAGAAVRADPPADLAFLHSVIVQCGLPYRDPGPAARHWERHQGAATLRLEAGCAYLGPDGPYDFVGLPYGEKPRLILLHLSTEALRTGSPEVDLGGSLTEFAAALGLPTDGRTLRALRDQFIRLAAATIRFAVVDGDAVRHSTVHLIGSYDM